MLKNRRSRFARLSFGRIEQARKGLVTLCRSATLLRDHRFDTFEPRQHGRNAMLSFWGSRISFCEVEIARLIGSLATAAKTARRVFRR